MTLSQSDDEQVFAFEMIRDPIDIMRGCFGGCTSRSITMHEGRVIQSPGHRSILAEVETVCRRPSCIHPEICILLSTDHGPTIDLMRAARAVVGV